MKSSALRQVVVTMFLLAALASSLANSTRAQDPPPATPTPATTDAEPVNAARQVDVQPFARDGEIADRLTRILDSTQWFVEPRVAVENGVVFLRGKTTSENYKKWAGTLAQQTQDVAVVVNQLEVIEGPLLDFSPAWEELRNIGRWSIQKSPLFAAGAIVLVAGWFSMHGMRRFAYHYLWRRQPNELLRDALSRLMAVPVLLLAIYFAFQIAGLTRLAATILGGTGLIGLVIGIAFRDITENFLASMLISSQNPFRVGDVITIDGKTGVVQKVTVRGTMLLSYDGTSIQIPNSIVYKSIVFNRSVNPLTRQETLLTLPPASDIQAVQDAVLEALKKHPAVVSDPEPLMLVEKLGPFSLDVRVLFWFDGQKHSPQKVLSSVLRSIRAALDRQRQPAMSGVGVIPRGDLSPHRAPQTVDNGASQPHKRERIRTAAEGSLASETPELQAQAERAERPEEGPNLLKSDAAQAP